ncbi:MAG: hypothetical protein U0168_12230 [Nannocystaceae bacterium]
MGGTTEAEATAVYEVLLHGACPKQAPQLAFVAPFDPLHSYADREDRVRRSRSHLRRGAM